MLLVRLLPALHAGDRTSWGRGSCLNADLLVPLCATYFVSSVDVAPLSVCLLPVGFRPDHLLLFRLAHFLMSYSNPTQTNTVNIHSLRYHPLCGGKEASTGEQNSFRRSVFVHFRCHTLVCLSPIQSPSTLCFSSFIRWSIQGMPAITVGAPSERLCP